MPLLLDPDDRGPTEVVDGTSTECIETARRVVIFPQSCGARPFLGRPEVVTMIQPDLSMCSS